MTVGGATTILNTLASGTTAGLKTVTTQGGGTGEWADTGTADLKLTVTSSAGTTAVCCSYYDYVCSSV